MIYRKGSVLQPVENGKLMLAHGCNDLGFGGAGVIVPIAKTYPEAYQSYVDWFKNGMYWLNNFAVKAQIGEIQIVKISDDYSVCNAVTQRGVGKDKYGYIPFRYESFRECMCKLNDVLHSENFDYLTIPRIGSGLAGGKWDLIEKIIKKTIHIPVVVYDLPSDNWPNTKYKD